VLAIPSVSGCPQPPTENATILVVDDDPEVREIVAEFLIDAGHHVLQAGGGLEALKVLAETAEVDLVITDVRMPDISGIELADRITRERQGLKVILISGFFVAKQTGLRLLRKPFRMKELEEAVQAELAS
jgi:CheY-like chemotaxis protein